MVDQQELSSAGLKFMDFAIRFFNMAKCQYQQQNQVKANKAGFQVLLSMPEYTQPTMSFLADEMGITKQQLTKLVNDLEAMGLVKRIHDERNRRQVYVTLTDDGRNEFEEIKQAMLECTVAGLKDFSEDELEQLGDCLERLIPLLEKFRGNC
jgi:DNA-binding MarR family transcriptional regulator